MGTNTSDIEVRPQRDGTREITLDVNVQASLLLVDVILPSVGNEQVAMPHINLSISGYEPKSLRDSHIRTQDTRIQGNSMIPQLDGPASILTRDQRRMLEDIRPTEQRYSQGGTYLQGASTSQRREYPGESSNDSNNDRRTYRD